MSYRDLAPRQDELERLRRRNRALERAVRIKVPLRRFYERIVYNDRHVFVVLVTVAILIILGVGIALHLLPSLAGSPTARHRCAIACGRQGLELRSAGGSDCLCAELPPGRPRLRVVEP